VKDITDAANGRKVLLLSTQATCMMRLGSNLRKKDCAGARVHQFFYSLERSKHANSKSRREARHDCDDRDLLCALHGHHAHISSHPAPNLGGVGFCFRSASKYQGRRGEATDAVTAASVASVMATP
jgi:hypothetical protein